MHILIINFELNGIDRTQYEGACAEIAEHFAAIPGLSAASVEATETFRCGLTALPSVAADLTPAS